MPTREQITTFSDPPVPEGESPWVGAARPGTVIEIVDADPAWSAAFDRLEARIRAALGPRVLQLAHVGSTAVPGLPAKPLIDVDLIVADPEAEAGWLPPLEAAGLVLRVREPWWEGHRLLRAEDPVANVHVFGPDAAEPWRHRVLRDHLRRDEADRDRYAAAKRAAAEAATAAGEHVEQYNARKEEVLRRIVERAFRAAGLLPT